DGCGSVGADLRLSLQVHAGDAGAITGDEFAVQRYRGAGGAGHLYRRLQSRITVLSVQVGDDGDVLNVGRRQRHQVVLAVDSAEAPVVAGVQIDRGRALADTQGEQVAPAGEEGIGDIDIEGRVAALVITDRL